MRPKEDKKQHARQKRANIDGGQDFQASQVFLAGVILGAVCGKKVGPLHTMHQRGYF
jgi:hypothetical protein